MVNRGKPTSGQAKTKRRGPQKLAAQQLTAWDVALDLLEPGTVPRMTRYRLVMARMDHSDQPRTQEVVAKQIDCEPRALNAYLTEDPKRPASVSLKQHVILHKCDLSYIS